MILDKKLKKISIKIKYLFLGCSKKSSLYRFIKYLMLIENIESNFKYDYSL